MIRAGKKVELRIDLLTKHQGVRFDKNTTAAPARIPKGATGTIVKVESAEIQIELYSNPSHIPGAGDTYRLWVKRPFFGILLLLNN